MGKFPKYSLTAKQIRGLANIVQHEQGSKAGFYAEASLMANLTDIHGDMDATPTKLISKVCGGWFAYGKKRYQEGYDGKVSVSATAIKAVENCIVKGFRTLPRYVNEHDCLSDIKSVDNGTKSNKHAWVKHKTVIHNRYGSNWIFYDFPGGSHTGVDPFGYTSKTYREKYGDFCYTLAEAEEAKMGDYKETLRDPLSVWKKGYIDREDEGASVKEVQKFINWLFGCGIEEDGKYGPATAAWVGTMQTYFGITCDEKYGHASYTKATEATVADAFKGHLIFYDVYVKAHGKMMEYNGSADKPFATVKKKIAANQKVKVNCIAPAVWAMADLNFTTENFYAKLGSFKAKYTGTITKHTTRYTSGHGVGKTIKQAVDEKLLKAGDILCFEGLTHAFVYSGKKYKVYEAGSYVANKGYTNAGCMADYSLANPYKARKISEVIRWK